jgi:hypothetical protein
MRRLCFIFSIFTPVLLLLLTALPAFSQATPATGPAAQEAMGASATAGNKQAAPAQAAGAAGTEQADRGTQNRNDNTKIVVDRAGHAVRIFVDGKEILTINADGIQVNGSVTPGSFKNIPAPKPYPSHEK